ncbi:hypothetical protein SAMN02910413_1219 [Pseudobutyrivibrio sp. C4]|uniref:hypothetical protein n=1 Tax=Pseudobutyrivibrio sp. C4 TaxID=1520803 RepID=UPI0008CBE1A0|nr:hypothetical protein [Pseudobutyrivibrio sp. C4]SES91143.1 hypothetical protein SAMN02910413_1219 [Pseudobutyrivibrio sp. C4]
MAFNLAKSALNILSSPGDKLEARITDSGNKVLKFASGDGSMKASRTEYPNGTIHETRTYRR